MKNFIELKYHNNSKFEIVFENLTELKEDDRYVIFLKEGDVRPLALFLQYTTGKLNDVYIPYVTLKQIECLEISACCFTLGERYCTIYTFDSITNFRSNLKNILPKWNILEDNAVLFLSDEDYSRYIEWIDFSKHAPELNNLFINLYPNVDGILDDMIGCKKVSLIIPELHAEDKSCTYHIENINKVCKELKEKYRVERIELFVSHCFLPKLWHNGVMENKFAFNKQSFTNSDSAIFYHNIYIGYRVLNDNLFKHIDKITTTNSTGILEVQKSDRLEVVDVITFFKDNLLNIKQSI